jgi:hypothetical protein
VAIAVATVLAIHNVTVESRPAGTYACVLAEVLADLFEGEESIENRRALRRLGADFVRDRTYLHDLLTFTTKRRIAISNAVWAYAAEHGTSFDGTKTGH